MHQRGNPHTIEQALAHYRRGAWEAAAAVCESILAIEPCNYDALHRYGLVEYRRGHHESAAELLGRAVAVNPDSAAAHGNRGLALAALGRLDEALESYARALAIQPSYPAALCNRASALRGLRRYDEALASCEAALALDAHFVDALNNRGNVLRDLGRLQDALAGYERALEHEPRHAHALNNRANVLGELGRYAEAADTFARLLAIAPDFDFALGEWIRALLENADWTDYDARVSRLLEAVGAGRKAATPLLLCFVTDSPAAQLTCARTYAASRHAAPQQRLWNGERYAHKRIRVAYLSHNFHQHVQTSVAIGLYERHDRTRFETFAFSFGRDIRDPMRTRVEAAFEHFIDVRDTSDPEVAGLLRSLEIDIAVDLAGYEDGFRPGVLARRPVPVQLSYLSLPATMGADWIDYVIADRHVIPPESAQYFSERVVRLPVCYQINDPERKIAEATPSRAALGLPDHGFVFCGFSRTSRITPAVFDVWMRLLAATPGSVLWLLDGGEVAMHNLRREAASRGVAPSRLVEAPRVGLPAHLARMRVADLFLDTFPLNAHTTASEVLWAGLPLVTCKGHSFASRVAASLLDAVGLPELVTGSLGDYETLALKLVNDVEGLRAIRTKLARSIAAAPLFDASRTVREIEAAYAAMVERSRHGEAPASFDVGPAA